MMSSAASIHGVVHLGDQPVRRVDPPAPWYAGERVPASSTVMIIVVILTVLTSPRTGPAP
jgi:hypothetical protein